MPLSDIRAKPLTNFSATLRLDNMILWSGRLRKVFGEKFREGENAL